MKLYYFSGACSLASNISVLSWGRFVNIDLGEPAWRGRQLGAVRGTDPFAANIATHMQPFSERTQWLPS